LSGLVVPAQSAFFVVIASEARQSIIFVIASEARQSSAGQSINIWIATLRSR
jgi:hypothetical protein